MRAGARGRQHVAGAAEERRVEAQRSDAQLARRELLEDLLRFERTVVAAHAGVVAADDEVRDAVVLPHQGVEEGLPRTRVAHRRGEGGEQRPIGRVVPLEQRLVGAEAHLGGDVVSLRLAHQRMDDEPVGELQRELGQVLVRAVDRVPRLEAGHAAPASFGDAGAKLAGAQPVARERRRVGQ